MALNHDEAGNPAVAVVEEEDEDDANLEGNDGDVSNNLVRDGPNNRPAGNAMAYSCPPPYFPGSMSGLNPYLMANVGDTHCVPSQMDPIQAQLVHYEARMRDHAAAFASAAASAAYFAAQLANNIQQQMDLSLQVLTPMHAPMGSASYSQQCMPYQTMMQQQHIRFEQEMHHMALYQGQDSDQQGRYNQQHQNNHLFSCSSGVVDPHTASRQRSRDRHRSQHDEGASQPNKRRQKIPQQPILQPTTQPSTSTPLFSIMESSSTLMAPISSPADQYKNKNNAFNYQYHRPLFADQQPLYYASNNSNKRRISHSYNKSVSVPINQLNHAGSAACQLHSKRIGKNHHLQQVSPRPLNLTGKTGVMALHELCSKCHWEAPRFVEATDATSSSTEPKNHDTADSSATQQKSKRKLTTSSSAASLSSTGTATTNSTPLNSHEFFISTFINSTLYGSGRGGTKAAARQDAARKALMELLPGIEFDVNGIVLQMPLTQERLLTASSFAATIQPSDFSRLAIDPQEPEPQCNSRSSAEAARAESPAPSEDSSSVLSIATSSVASAGRPGPSKFQRTVLFNSCASSGISSASEDDENTYYASRGASVCSSLLHAMWQIDEHIKEPPHYSFEVILPKPTIKSVGSKSPLPDGRSTPLHRSSFSCTASLVLHDDRKSIGIDYSEHDRTASELSNSRSSEDSDSSGADKNVIAAIKDPNATGRASWLEAVGTGATKREARHAASAKLLALLFPACSGLVEVIAAAESAREAYAASKVQYRQNRATWSSSCGGNNVKHGHKDPDYESIAPTNDTNKCTNKVVMKHTTTTEAPTHNNQLSKSNPNRKDLHSWSDSLNVENLSISESKANDPPDLDEKSDEKTSGEHENRLIQFSSRSKSLVSQHLSRLLQIDKEVDAALQKLYCAENERNVFGKVSDGEDDIGKVILRRALFEDAPLVAELFHLNCDNDRGAISRSDNLQSAKSLLTPLPLLSSSSEWGDIAEEPIQEANTPYAGVSCERRPVILILCRAVLEKIPLACAVLTPCFCVGKGDVFQISSIAHKEHLPPRERVVEYLEAFASCMKYELEDPGESFSHQQRLSEK